MNMAERTCFRFLQTEFPKAGEILFHSSGVEILQEDAD